MWRSLPPQLQQEIQVRQNECSRETRRKEKLEKEVKQMHADLEAKQGDIKVLSQQGQRSKEEQQRLEQQLREQKVRGNTHRQTPTRLRDSTCDWWDGVLAVSGAHRRVQAGR